MSIEDDMKEFESQLKNINSTTKQELINETETKTLTVTKNLVLAFPTDYSGCGHIRVVFPLNYVNSVFGRDGKLQISISSLNTFQPDHLARARTLFFQRYLSPKQVDILKQYKKLQPKYKYKMIWEIDDYLWGYNETQKGGNIEDGVPSYNFGSQRITDEIKKASVEAMNLVDVVVVSTEFLKYYVKDVLKVTAEVIVMPNAVAQYLWGVFKKPDIKERLVKPRVIYTGSPTHYLNPIKDKNTDKFIFEPKLGDWNNAWKDWVIKSVKEDKIDFIVLGGLPWFFDEIKDKITVHNFIDSYRYHTLVKMQVADIGIMPLVPNNFNRGKSDIKAIEHYADGVPCIGSVFEGEWKGPYENNPLTLPTNCTVEDIDKLFNELCEPEMYNRIKNEQYKKLYTEGRWIESAEYVNKWTRLI